MPGTALAAKERGLSGKLAAPMGLASQRHPSVGSVLSHRSSPCCTSLHPCFSNSSRPWTSSVRPFTHGNIKPALVQMEVNKSQFEKAEKAGYFQIGALPTRQRRAGLELPAWLRSGLAKYELSEKLSTRKRIQCGLKSRGKPARGVGGWAGAEHERNSERQNRSSHLQQHLVSCALQQPSGQLRPGRSLEKEASPWMRGQEFAVPLRPLKLDLQSHFPLGSTGHGTWQENIRTSILY